jgi:hypothetical protein
VTDDELRRRIFWQQLGELLLVVAVASIVAYWSVGLVLEMLREGRITLYAGGRGGPKTPVHLSTREAPFGVVGTVLLFCAFAIGTVRLVASPAYHVLRTGLPSLKLPRVPRSLWMRRISGTHFGLVLVLAALGVGLVVYQYTATALR